MLAPPVGGGATRRYLPLASLVLGTTAGGVLMGAGLVVAWYALAPFDVARAAAVVAVAALGGTAVVLPALRTWLPDAACQVPSRRMTEAMHTAALRWGVELGVGIRTFSVTPALYVLLAVTLVQGASWYAAVVSGVYGLSRGATIASFSVVSARRTADGAGLPGIGLERALRIPVVAVIAAATVLGVS